MIKEIVSSTKHLQFARVFQCSLSKSANEAVKDGLARMAVNERPIATMSEPLFILVAEDDENDVFFLKRAFVKAGIFNPYHVVADGQSAVEYLSGFGKYADRALYPLPQMAIFDIKMPRKTGLEVLQWVRQHPQLKNLPVMILTSSSEERDQKQAERLGASAYFVKTASSEILSSELKKFYNFWQLYCEAQRRPK